MDKEIRVKFQGGREVIGVLKGYDQLQNLVLDEVREEPSGEQSWWWGFACDCAFADTSVMRRRGKARSEVGSSSPKRTDDCCH